MNSINPYDALPERMHNCPQCGGTLQDDGKCRFCGSTVYDFLGIDMDNQSPVFIRMKHDGRIVHFKVRITSVNLHMFQPEPAILYSDNNPVMELNRVPDWTGDVDFQVVSPIVVEDTKVTGSEY